MSNETSGETILSLHEIQKSSKTNAKNLNPFFQQSVNNNMPKISNEY